MRRLIFGTASAAMLVAGGAVAPAIADDMAGNGTVSYVTKNLAGRNVSTGNLGIMHAKGTIIASDPAHPMHLNTHDCTGSAIADANGAPTGGAGNCVAVDGDGDVWWLWYRSDAMGSTWGVMGGTGKFEDAEGGGTTKNIALSPDGRLTISWEGTIKMK